MIHGPYNVNPFNPLNAELNPIRHLLALVGARHIVHVSRIRVNLTYNGRANVSAGVRCLVLMKMFGNPSKFFITIIRNSDVRINECRLFLFPFLKIVFITWCGLFINSFIIILFRGGINQIHVVISIYPVVILF